MLTKGITYKELIASFKKGLRNGNWRKLRFLDKALYRAAMGYARNGRSMMNGKLVEKLLELVAGLKETKGMRIFKGGFEKAVELLGERRRERDVCMVAFVTALVERPGLYLSSGWGRCGENFCSPN